MTASKQQIGRAIWSIAILSGVLFYVLYPDQFTANKIAASFSQHHDLAILAYLLVSVTRGLFLLPSTPFVLAGVLLFPEDLPVVFLISMTGVLAGSAIVYLFSDALGFSDSLRGRYQRLYPWVAEKMTRHGTPIVIGWAFFPWVPTDLISCIAGATKMGFWRFLLAIGIGESVLVAAYIFTGQAIFPWLMSYASTP
jgi:uncharacterized membrane protein YdjX (TVP38/TMEM64 family)